MIWVDRRASRSIRRPEGCWASSCARHALRVQACRRSQFASMRSSQRRMSFALRQNLARRGAWLVAAASAPMRALPFGQPTEHKNARAIAAADGFEPLGRLRNRIGRGHACPVREVPAGTAPGSRADADAPHRRTMRTATRLRPATHQEQARWPVHRRRGRRPCSRRSASPRLPRSPAARNARSRSDAFQRRYHVHLHQVLPFNRQCRRRPGPPVNS